MSIRFIPAPARVQPYYDDGIPLSAKIVDHEDYRPLGWQTQPIAVQTLYQDEPFKLVVITFPGDDEPAFVWPIPPQQLGLRALLTEDDALPNAANFPGDESIGMATIVTADKVWQVSAYIDEDVLPITSGFTPLFRKTLSSIGGRIGQRQLQNGL